MKYGTLALDCPATRPKRRRSEEPRSPPHSHSHSRAKRRRFTPDPLLALLPSPPASVSSAPLALATDKTAACACRTPSCPLSLQLPDDVDLISPHSPLYCNSVPDADFEVLFWKAWEDNMARTAETKKLRQALREYKYGKQVAALYSPGATPEKVASEYFRREEELAQQYEEEVSDMSDNGEKQAVRRINDDLCARGAKDSEQAISPSTRLLDKHKLQPEGHEIQRASASWPGDSGEICDNPGHRRSRLDKIWTVPVGGGEQWKACSCGQYADNEILELLSVPSHIPDSAPCEAHVLSALEIAATAPRPLLPSLAASGEDVDISCYPHNEVRPTAERLVSG